MMGIGIKLIKGLQGMQHSSPLPQSLSREYLVQSIKQCRPLKESKAAIVASPVNEKIPLSRQQSTKYSSKS